MIKLRAKKDTLYTYVYRYKLFHYLWNTLWLLGESGGGGTQIIDLDCRGNVLYTHYVLYTAVSSSVWIV